MGGGVERFNFAPPHNLPTSLSYWKKTMERIFQIDERIRYVGIVDMEYHVIESEMRPGVSSLTPVELDRSFVSIFPNTMLNAAKTLEKDCGPFQIMSIRYRRLMIAIYRGERYMVMLSFDSSVETPFLRRLKEELDRIDI